MLRLKVGLLGSRIRTHDVDSWRYGEEDPDIWKSQAQSRPVVSADSLSCHRQATARVLVMTHPAMIGSVRREFHSFGHLMVEAQALTTSRFVNMAPL